MTGSRWAGAPLLLALLAGGPGFAYAKGPHVPGHAAAIAVVPKIGHNAAVGLVPAHNVGAAGLRPAAAATPAAIGRVDAATPSLSGPRRVDHPGVGLKRDKLGKDSLSVVEIATDKTEGRNAGKSEDAARSEPAPTPEAGASSNATAAAEPARVLPTCR